MESKYFEKALIPNKDQYQFIGLKHDGAEIICKVVKLEGSYRLAGNAISAISAWRPMTKEEKRANA